MEKGQRVKLLFDDLGKATVKFGEVVDFSDGLLTLKMNSGTEVIPRERILRIEVLK